MAVQIPFPLPATGYALNSKVRINLDFIVSKFNEFNTGSATWDTVAIGTANSINGALTLYNDSNAFYLTIQAGATNSNTTYTLPTSLPAAGDIGILGSNESGTLSWNPASTYITGGTGITVADDGDGTVTANINSSQTLSSLEMTVGNGVYLVGYDVNPNKFGVTLKANPNTNTNFSLFMPKTAGTVNQLLASDGTYTEWQDNPVVAGTRSYLPIYYIVSGTNSSVRDYIEYSGNTVRIGLADHTGLGSSRSYTIPNAGANASFVMTNGSASITGAISIIGSNPLTVNSSYLQAAEYRIRQSGGSNYYLTLSPSTLTSTHTWNLPAGNAAGVLTNDGSGNLSWGAAGSGASTALDNLASVAINTSLISDTNNTDDLGSAGIGWANGYINQLLMDGSTSGTVTVKPAAVAGTWTLTLPANDGDANQVLVTDGSGNTSWADAATGGTVYREDYVVGSASGNYSGSTTVFDLTGTYTTGDDSLTVFVDGVLQTIGAGNDYVETDTNTVTFNSALVTGQKVTFYFSVPTSATDYATKALDNLGSVAINTSLISDTDNTDDLGSSSIAWKDIYLKGALKSGATTLATATELGYLSGATSNIQDQINAIGGKVLQVVSASSTSIFTTTSSSFQNTNLSATITPSSTANKILIMASASIYTANGSLTEVIATLARGSTNLAGAVGMNTGQVISAVASFTPSCMLYVDSPATTSATTYRAQVKNTDGSTTVAYGRTNQDQRMILIEIEG